MKWVPEFKRYGLSVAIVAGAASSGYADPVGNPGDFEFDLPHTFDTCLGWSNGGCLPLTGTGSTPYFQVELDGAGDVTYIDSFLPYGETRTISGNQVTATLRFTNITGSVDIQVPSVELYVTARVRFDIPSLSTNCTTNSFLIKLHMDDFGESHCPTDGYDGLTGEFCLASWGDAFTIPALAATACANNGNAISSSFGLGSSGTELHLWNGIAYNMSTSDPIQP